MDIRFEHFHMRSEQIWTLDLSPLKMTGEQIWTLDLSTFI